MRPTVTLIQISFPGRHDKARAALGSALTRAGKFPLVDRGVALVSMAVAIAVGATSMTDITVLAHHAAVLGPEPSDTPGRPR